MIETHPLTPFVPENAKVLMLGSFPPPPSRWRMNFYYPNWQNDMWRIFGLVFFNDKNHFIHSKAQEYCEAMIREFLNQQGIAISDMAYQVERLQGNASDQFLRVIKPVDLDALLARLPHCHSIMTTGGKATDILCGLFPDKMRKPSLQQVGSIHIHGRQIHWFRVPSTSRAYPLPLLEKATMYAGVFAQLGWVTML